MNAPRRVASVVIGTAMGVGSAIVVAINPGVGGFAVAGLLIGLTVRWLTNRAFDAQHHH